MPHAAAGVCVIQVIGAPVCQPLISITSAPLVPSYMHLQRVVLPQPVVEAVQRLHAVPLVHAAHLRRRHLCQPDGQRRLLALRVDGLRGAGAYSAAAAMLRRGSCMRTTGVSSSTSSCSVAPADVSPGHMMFAPANTKRMAPLSTRRRGIISGSGAAGPRERLQGARRRWASAHWCSTRSVGKYGPSRMLKKRMVLFTTTRFKWLALRAGRSVAA